MMYNRGGRGDNPNYGSSDEYNRPYSGPSHHGPVRGGPSSYSSNQKKPYSLPPEHYKGGPQNYHGQSSTFRGHPQGSQKSHGNYSTYEDRHWQPDDRSQCDNDSYRRTPESFRGSSYDREQAVIGSEQQTRDSSGRFQASTGDGSQWMNDRTNFGSQQINDRTGGGSQQMSDRFGGGSQWMDDRTGGKSQRMNDRTGFGSQQMIGRSGGGSQWINTRTGGGSQWMNDRTGGGSQQMNDRTGGGNKRMNDRIDGGSQSMNDRTGGGNKRMNDRTGFGSQPMIGRTGGGSQWMNDRTGDGSQRMNDRTGGGSQWMNDRNESNESFYSQPGKDSQGYGGNRWQNDVWEEYEEEDEQEEEENYENDGFNVGGEEEEEENEFSDDQIVEKKDAFIPTKEMCEKYQYSPPSAEEMGEIFKGFIIYFFIKSNKPKKENIFVALCDSFRNSSNFNDLDVEDGYKEDYKNMRICTLRYGGILLSRGVDQNDFTKAARINAAAELINKLAKTCYTLEMKAEYYLNKSNLQSMLEKKEVPGVFRVVPDSEIPTFYDAQKYIESFFKEDTDCELVFSKFGLDIKGYCRDSGLVCRTFKQKDWGKVAVSKYRTAEYWKDKLLRSRQMENEKFKLIPPTGNGEPLLSENQIQAECGKPGKKKQKLMYLFPDNPNLENEKYGKEIKIVKMNFGATWRDGGRGGRRGGGRGRGMGKRTPGRVGKKKSKKKRR